MLKPETGWLMLKKLTPSQEVEMTQITEENLTDSGTKKINEVINTWLSIVPQI